MIVLGIETSCDDTGAALLQGGRVLANVVASQDAVHGPYGGVVPELAARQHLVTILPVLDGALRRAGVDLGAVSGIAVTYGPGLVGSLLIGLQVAKAIARHRRIPMIGINHLEGHLLSAQLSRPVPFPFVGLVVSGGHTSLYLAEDWHRYRCLGCTRDDAAGEAFDKVAKLLELGYPGGPAIDRLARDGDPRAVRFPRARMVGEGYEFSFSGLKTAVALYRAQHPGVAAAHIAASFQEAVVDVLVEQTLAAARAHGIRAIVVAGGVSANSRLRARMDEAAAAAGIEVFVPPPRLCTDNGAMIALAGARRLARGERHGFDLNPQAALPVGSP